MAAFALFLNFLLYLVVAKGEYCTPGAVPDIKVSSDEILRWSEALNPDNCALSGYVVDILDPEYGHNFQFYTTSDILNYNLSGFEFCKSYQFEVHAQTDQGILGPSEWVTATIPPPANLDLTLAISDPILNSSNDLTISWNLEVTGFSKCISYYRIVYRDEGNIPTDVYVHENMFVLPNPQSCTKYKFEVTAFINDPDQQGTSAELNWDGYSAVSKPPKLVDIHTSETSVNMTWRVPQYDENRCQLTALVVDGLGLPATVIPIEDSSSRPDINVYIKDLTANTVYICHISLENSAGSSKNVTVTFQTSDDFVFNYARDLIY